MKRLELSGRIYVLISCLVILGFLGMSSLQDLIEDRPNIVMILADDMRWDYLAISNPNAIVKTPHLNELARQGTRFENAFVTSSICTPSRTSILTGQYERKHGVTFGSNSALTEKAFAQTYPMLLKNAGYFTGYVGKNHTPVGVSDQGWGYNSGVMEQSFDYWMAGHRHLTFYPKKKHTIFQNAKSDNQIDIIQEYVDAFLNPLEIKETTQAFLTKRPKDKPFCLMVNFNVPHSSSTNSMQMLASDPLLYRTGYRDQTEEILAPTNYVAFNDIETPKIPKQVYNGQYLKSYDWVKTKESLKENQIRTCATVTGLDQVVGSIVYQLKAQKILENTIIIFTSDHGLFHGEEGLGGKTLLYDVAIKVPMIVYAPGLSNGAVMEELALNIDIAPTILDFAEVEIPDQIQGKSLKSLMEGHEDTWRIDFFCENMFMGQNYPRMEAVRSKRWKYIRYFDKSLDRHHLISLVSPLLKEEPIYEELYDLSMDPNEELNLASRNDKKAIEEHYRARCSELLKEAKADSGLPMTHVKDFNSKGLGNQVNNIYHELKAVF